MADDNKSSAQGQVPNPHGVEDNNTNNGEQITEQEQQFLDNSQTPPEEVFIDENLDEQQLAVLESILAGDGDILEEMEATAAGAGAGSGGGHSFVRLGRIELDLDYPDLILPPGLTGEEQPLDEQDPDYLLQLLTN